MSSVGRNDEKFAEQNDQQQHLYLKESKINGSTHPNSQNSDSPRKNLTNMEYLEHAGNPAINISNRNTDSSFNVNYMRMDPRYQNNHSENNRQRFADQKYPSFDERQYYSDRERSRPPSTTSIGEKPEDYYYGNGMNRRGGQPENARPSSRMSESDLSRGDRNGQYGYTRQQYPYAYPPGYSRNAEYYQRHPNYRGYECDPYQRYSYYAPYYDAYGYDYSNYNYGFYDELYRNDPRYRQYREAQEQHRQYYAKYGYETDYDRSSIRSGRSSANELSKDMSSSQYPEPDIDSNESEFSTYNLQQNYSYDDVRAEVSAEVPDHKSTPSARLTPVKYSYAHPIARFSPGGMLITVMPNPLSTALATPVTIHSLQVIMENEESFQELKNYQGPLVRGLTHKNDVIEFCSQKIKSLRQKEDIVDRDSYILLWELMIVLLRQNGSVAGSDIAELLLKDHEVLRPHTVPLRHAIETPQGEQSPADVNDSSSQSHAGDTSSPDEGIVVLHDKSSLNTSHTVDVDKVTRKFREFLLFGHKKDALEWAMKHGLWGHALFLASKMDLRTYANVMTRFANSLALNDPLQTLYQLMSGRQPSAVTCVADKKWGDWRPHLAMILSNPSTHPDVDSRSITTLGDTLASRGCLPAAHFCYIMAQVEFGTFEQKNSKVVLLTADHTLSFDEFATNEAIHCTEIYEYAQSLANPGYMLTHLQLYKFLYAMRLVEHGFLEEALHYCEVIAGNLQVHPNLFSLDFISEVFKLATQLKYHDPHFLRGQGEFEEQDDPEWLKNLSALVQNYSNILQGENSNLYYEQQLESSQNMNSGSETNPPAESSSYQSVSSTVMQNEINNSYNYYQPNSWNNMFQNSAVLSNNQQDNQSVNAYYQPEMMKKFNTESSIPSHEENETTDVPSSPVTQTPPFDYYSGGTQQMMENKQSSYEAVNSYNSSSTPRERRDSAMSTASRYSSGSLSVSNKNRESQKPEPKKEKPSNQAGKTWLGGIFSRLLPKAPNQMILPDDKNPTIVWDDVKNCWVNKDSNDDDECNTPVAPPTDMELSRTKPSEKTYTTTPGNSMSGPPTVNKFQRPKTRVMRQNYVDILNSSGSTVKTSVAPEALFPTAYDHTTSPKMFIPQSVPSVAEASTDFESQESFNTSQLDTEEKSQPHTAPLMFDPAEFDSRSSSMGSQKHMLGRNSRRTYPT
ncbi:protein transport protein Sec16A-like [Stegodyphus dumicola]|uniref:protein transport protein Sec16A-like n=1 Tax=Stegodyphus dumicola TaxID=202533 RepID=UPI0015A834C4|nr:protein transport protein Sec16A-like [Stegodyphus dumicola]